MTIGNHEREAIEDSYESLIKNLSITSLLDKLLNEKVLQGIDQRQIRRERNLKRRNIRFLQILQQKSNEEFYRFCKVLELSDTEILVSLGQTLRKEAENKCQDIEINEENQVTEINEKNQVIAASPPNNGIILEDTESDFAHVMVDVFAWGNNHSGELGIPLSKNIEYPAPARCKAISKLRPIMIKGGHDKTYILSQEGKVYGIGQVELKEDEHDSKNLHVPRLINGLSHLTIIKLAIHPDGHFALGITIKGELYSWGETPAQQITSVKDAIFTNISCGRDHRAAITNQGKLYTWGYGGLGCLGHGNSKTCLEPTLVEALADKVVIDVACGSANQNHTVAVTSDDKVWSWGDPAGGKLGRIINSTKPCTLPGVIDGLLNKSVHRVICGSAFTLALTTSGSLYSWGHGSHYHSQHGIVGSVERPKIVDVLKDKRVIAIAAGSLHWLACTIYGEIYAWGNNDAGQLGVKTLKSSTDVIQVDTLMDEDINQVSCGFSHCFAWKSSLLQIKE
ncbi:E3 ubiquitin-protein ligase HERC2 [Trichoplax sp. H2]|nr:E3 ubiquitin-protein ligase HERC2 [Trichoplax sp. H2]|eukprot:RDD44049.1 E3 ubiquitin-protein ligase HERC2 [Trichoplax sp. H2]